MNIIHAIILGVVEGITEFLPISSTAHLIFTTEILGIPLESFTKSFEIIIQSGAILAALFYFGKKILADKELILKAIVGFIPTGVAGFFLYKTIKQALGGGSTIAWVLVGGGIVMLFLERFFRKKKEMAEMIEEKQPDGVIAQADSVQITYLQAFIIGCFQCIALIPGVSRSASTIYGGRLLGIERSRVIDFSFLIAIPTMGAATSYDLLKNASSFTLDQTGVLVIGFIVSFFVAYAAIASFLAFIKKYSFSVFGWYRIVVGILALLFLF